MSNKQEIFDTLPHETTIALEQELFDMLQFECAVEILKQEIPDITDAEIAEVVALEPVKANWANAVPMYHIMKAMRS